MNLRLALLLCFALLIVGACPWNDELREYLSTRFWLPFAKHAASFEEPNVPRLDAPFAGMANTPGDTPLTRLRLAYQQSTAVDPALLRQSLAAARAAQSLTPRDREEIDLIDAKLDIRSAQPGDDPLLHQAQQKLEAFLHTAQTPEFQSEARGWLARVHYLSGRQAAAGKIYLDELNHPNSNLSRETLLNSLHMTYGYDGGPQLLDELDQYFDTPFHAAFAIQLVTNPHWLRGPASELFPSAPSALPTYQRIRKLLASHEHLLRSENGSEPLALLAMRTALRMGDPAGALKTSASVPPRASARLNPDFQWMLASALFLSRQYAAAEKPLLGLFRSPRASNSQKAAAAYGLCGVYFKTGIVPERLRFALWLHAPDRGVFNFVGLGAVSDLSVYWASSGWDLNLLLETEASVDQLQSFITQNPKLANIRLVKYALAVRLSREERYEEAAALYLSIHAIPRARRLAQLAVLHQTARQKPHARYELAAFLAANPNRIYFNDTLWSGMQRYALQADTEYRVTRAERARLLRQERELKDAQEERWRAYLLLRDLIREEGPTPLGRQAASLALRCLRAIRTDRFGRDDEIRRADIELSSALHHTSPRAAID